MSFIDSVINNDEKITSKEKQLRINLSQRAYSVIHSDIIQFNIDMRETIFNPSNFICRIFINSRNKLNSFVSSRVEQVSNDYSNLIKPGHKAARYLTQEQLDSINDLIVKIIQEHVIQESENYIKELINSKQNGFVIYVNKEMMYILISVLRMPQMNSSE